MPFPVLLLRRQGPVTPSMNRKHATTTVVSHCVGTTSRSTAVPLVVKLGVDRGGLDRRYGYTGRCARDRIMDGGGPSEAPAFHVIRAGEGSAVR